MHGFATSLATSDAPLWYFSEDEPGAKGESEVEPKEGRGRKRAGKKKTGAQKKRERAAREEGLIRI